MQSGARLTPVTIQVRLLPISMNQTAESKREEHACASNLGGPWHAVMKFSTIWT